MPEGSWYSLFWVGHSRKPLFERDDEWAKEKQASIDIVDEISSQYTTKYVRWRQSINNRGGIATPEPKRPQVRILQCGLDGSTLHKWSFMGFSKKWPDIGFFLAIALRVTQADRLKCTYLGIHLFEGSVVHWWMMNVNLIGAILRLINARHKLDDPALPIKSTGESVFLEAIDQLSNFYDDESD